MGAYRLVEAVSGRIYWFCKGFIMFLLCLLTALVFGQVFSRFTGIDMSWAEGPVTFCFSWLSYIGAAVVFHDNGHIGVSLLIDRLPPLGKRICVILSQVIIIVFAIVVVRWGCHFVSVFNRTGQHDANIMWLKISWVYCQVPLAHALFILFGIEHILKEFFQIPAKPADGEYETGDLNAKG
jgi:TRAP-type C4-dicarboxylate transport system permease small subunit